MKPYTYRIELKHTRQKYYGVKFALDADPDTFWVEYFTSSKVIHDLIDKHGRENLEQVFLKT